MSHGLHVKLLRVSLCSLGDCTHVGHSTHKDPNEYTGKVLQVCLPHPVL